MLPFFLLLPGFKNTNALFSVRYICHMKHFCSLNVHAIVRYFFLVTAWCDDWMREVVLLSKTRYVIFAIVIRRMYLLSREVEPAQPWIQLSSWQIMWNWRKKGLSKDSLREACFFCHGREERWWVGFGWSSSSLCSAVEPAAVQTLALVVVRTKKSGIRGKRLQVCIDLRAVLRWGKTRKLHNYSRACTKLDFDPTT